MKQRRSTSTSSSTGSSSSGPSSANPSTERASSSAPASNSAALSTASSTEAESASGGVLGWLRGAGEWVGDTWDATTEAVGGAVGSAREFAGNAWDIVGSTDLDWEDGVASVETDLDEVHDLLPTHLAEALQLDESASSNRARLSFDTSSKEVTITIGDLALASLDYEGLTAGPTTLQGVVITLSNPGGGIPGLSGDFSLFGYGDKDDNGTVRATIESAIATEVSFEGGEGPVEAEQLELQGLTIDAAAQGGMPFGEGVQTEASFTVQGAVVRGPRHALGGADEVSASGVSGGLSSSEESARLSMAALAASGVQSADGHALGGADLRGVEATVDNRGGGLPLLDDKADDDLSANVSVAAASARDVSSGEHAVAQADLSDLEVLYAASSGATSGSLGRGSVSGASSGGHAVESASVSGVSGSFEGGQASGSVEQLAVRGASSEGLGGVDSLEVSGASGSFDTTAGTGRATVSEASLGGASGMGYGVDSARVQGVGADFDTAGNLTASVLDAQAEGADLGDYGSIDSLRATGVSGSKDEEGLSGRLGTLSGSGVDVADVQMASFAAGEVQATQDADKTTLDARTLGAEGVSAKDFEASRMRAEGARAELGPAQNVAELDEALLEEARVANRLDLDEAWVSQVRAAQIGGTDELSIGTAGVRGVTDSETGASLGMAELHGVQGSRDGEAIDATLDRARLVDGSYEGHGVEEASVSGVSVSTDDMQSGDLAVATAYAKGVSSSGLTVDEAHASAVQASGSAEQQQASVGSASASGVALSTEGTTASVSSVGATGIDVRNGSGGLAADVEQVRASGASFASTSSSSASEPSSVAVDQGALIRSGSALVDDVDLQASMRLEAGDYEASDAWYVPDVGVEEGTVAQADVQVRDGRIQDGTRVELNEGLDLPLWLSGDGAYVEDGRLRADVGGGPDIKVDKHVNSALGVEGKGLQSVADYGAGLADSMERGGPATAPTSGKPQIADAMDLESVRASGTVGLSAGTLDAGIGQVELAEGEGANEVQVDVDGFDQAAVSMARFLASGMSMNVEGNTLETGEAEVTGAQVTLDGGEQTTVSGEVGDVVIEDVSVRSPGNS